MIFACDFINFITVPLQHFFFAWKPKQLNDFMTYLGRYSHSYCLRCTSSAVRSFLHPILMKEICSTFLVFLNHFPCQFSKQRIKSIKKCCSSKIKNSQDLSTFASQGFRSWSPFSSPLADWAGFCNFRGSTSSSFHNSSLQKWNQFYQWVLSTVSCLGRCKMAEPCVYIFDCIHMMIPGSIVSGDLIGRS